ncbi:MAG: hypothetical protein HQL47_07560 [Gammaproteobacteria bacterium]|nr:hypothetical protein [Gammaproteobacteria bacterium]
MNRLLENAKPYGARSDAAFLAEMNALTQAHLQGCPEYARIWPDFRPAQRVEDLPYLHVGVFKQVDFKTQRPGIQHERVLKPSATTSGQASQIHLDRTSSELQSASSLAILKDFVGEHLRPLLVLDSSASLLARGEISARVAAAMSLRPISTGMHFLLAQANDAQSLKWNLLTNLLEKHDDLLVYGFTWILWQAWAAADWPEDIRQLLQGKRIHFVHSGGWKKLEDSRVAPQTFNASLLHGLHPDSGVTDFYGLVEQVGIIYPACADGYRHVPVWADVLVRDPWTLEPLIGETGQLQLLNCLAQGAPYHSVYTEDLGRIQPGACPCGRSGKRFELLGRVPQAEIRGCANV